MTQLTQREVFLQMTESQNQSPKNMTCSYCNKIAIGYETHTNCGIGVCKDHADLITLMLLPGYEIDLLQGKAHSTAQEDGDSYGGYTYFGGLRRRFTTQDPWESPEANVAHRH
jgi:hypothetical protein